jgi:serine/threonine-protein kinase
MPSDVFGIVGTTVAGAFRVEQVVAEGGFAVVYRAHHSGFKAPVALKCLKIPQYFTPDEQQAFREQFQAEAELLFKLSASIPTVVRPLHVEAVLAPDGSFMPFLALEWLEGETLDRHVRHRSAEGKRPPDLVELVDLLTPVARALERAHHFSGPSGPMSIVHRDMKPENIFVAQIGGEEVVKILDFGIAKAKSMASQVAGRMSRRESEGESFSPAYAAPEQWAPKRFGQTGPWTDVWGLALTVVEVAVGRPVIDGDNAAMMGTALDEKRRPTPRTEGLVVTDEVEGVFVKALAVDPRLRYPDAGAFWNALLEALGLSVPDGRLSHHGSGTFRAPSSPGLAPRGLAKIASGQVGLAPGGQSPGPGPMVPDLELPGAGASARQPLGLPAAASAPLGLPNRPGAAPLGLPGARQAGPAPAGRSVDLDEGPGMGLELDLDDDPYTQGSSGPAEVASEADVDLDGGTRPPSSRPPSRGATPAERVSGAGATPSPRPGRAIALESPPSTARRLLVPGVLVILGILITLGDSVYAASTGEVFTMGALRPTWIAALLVLGGIGWAGYRLLFEDED